MNSVSTKKRGALLIICSAFSFSLMTVFARLAGDVPAMQKTFFRNLVAIIVVFSVLTCKKQKVKIDKGHLPYLIMRAGFGTLGVIANFYAVDRLILSDVTMISNLSPFFAIIFSYLILHEKASFKQWSLIGLALFGMVFVVKPSAGIVSNPAVLLALCSAVSSGIAYTMIRTLSQKGVDSSTIVFFFSAFSCVVCLPSMMSNLYLWTRGQLFCMLLSSIFASLGQFAVTGAYKYAPASEISIFNYSQIIFAAVWGWIIFGEVADALSFAGYAVIFLAAILMVFTQKKE